MNDELKQLFFDPHYYADNRSYCTNSDCHALKSHGHINDSFNCPIRVDSEEYPKLRAMSGYVMTSDEERSVV